MRGGSSGKDGMGTGCQQVALSAVGWHSALPAPWGAPGGVGPGGVTPLLPFPGARLQPRCRCRCDTPCVGGQI